MSAGSEQRPKRPSAPPRRPSDAVGDRAAWWCRAGAGVLAGAWRPRRAGSALVAAIVVSASLAAAGDAGAPQRFRERERSGPVPSLENGVLPYDGRFTFARLRYETGMPSSGGFFRRGGWREPPWAHDYPRAERNFMKILKAVTTIDPYLGPAGGSIVGLGSPELFKYPVAYMSEPGFWTMTDAEAANLRRYFQKGGFVIFDDFRGADLVNFEEQLRRALPEARLVPLDGTHPIFHAFFDIDSPLDFVQMYDRGQPVFYGVFEDNDPKKRLLLIANYDNDIGEYWEYSDTGYTPIDLTNEAYKFGVNYIVYGLTH
jgi:hypothetical protein